MRPLLIVALLLSAVLAGCAALPENTYKLYPGPNLTKDKLAIIQLNDVYVARIDSLRVKRSDWKNVELLPGEHEIEWGDIFAVSVMIEPSGFAFSAQKVTMNLEPGHSYSLYSDRTKGHGYRMYLWMVDDTSGKVVAGEKIP